MALLPGSVAIGNGTAVDGITTDQRGVARPATGPDIGAFQSQGFTLTPVAGSTPQSATLDTPFANALGVSVAANDPIEPVAGGFVTFTAPSDGASATLSAATATIGTDGQASVSATANGTAGDYAVTVLAAGAMSPASFILTNLIQPVFSGLSDQTITYGTASVDVTGTLAAGSQVPTGDAVAITLDGVTQDVVIGSDGSFSATFTTATLRASSTAYAVTYAFAAQDPFLAADGSSQLTVNPAALVITAVSDTKTYDGTTTDTATPTFQVAGLPANTLFNGDRFSNLSQAFTSMDVLGAGGSTLQVSYAIDDGNGGNDYTVTTFTAAGTITPAALTISATANTKTYDGTTAASAVPTITAGSLATGDTAIFSESYATKNAGTGLTLIPVASVDDGNGGANYKVTFDTALGTINPATLTIAANNLSMPYGGAVPPLTASYAGFVDDDTPASLASPVVLDTSATSNSPAGVYAITASGASPPNYNIHYVNGTLTIDPPVTPTTPKARAAYGFVTTLYEEILGRGAEPTGLHYWTREYLGRLPTRTIWSLFARSPERLGLETEGRAPTIPLNVAYKDAVRNARRASHRPTVVAGDTRTRDIRALPDRMLQDSPGGRSAHPHGPPERASRATRRIIWPRVATLTGLTMCSRKSVRGASLRASRHRDAAGTEPRPPEESGAPRLCETLRGRAGPMISGAITFEKKVGTVGRRRGTTRHVAGRPSGDRDDREASARRRAPGRPDALRLGHDRRADRRRAPGPVRRPPGRG